MKMIASNGAEINTGDAVLVRDGISANWKYDIFSHFNNDDTSYPYFTIFKMNKYCIPYKGNENLVGTTKDYNVSKKKALTYTEKQERWVKKHNIKVGDKVRITRKANSNENGWNNNWVVDMTNLIHKIGTIIELNYTCRGISVIIDDLSYRYPYFVLEKVKNESESEFKFGAKVMATYKFKTAEGIKFKTVEGILIGYRNHKKWDTPYRVATIDNDSDDYIGETNWYNEIDYI